MILAALPGLGPVGIRKLDQLIKGGVHRLLEMETDEQAKWCSATVVSQLQNFKKFFDPDRVLRELDRQGADFITCEDEEYPAQLAPFIDRPIGLYRNRAGVNTPDRAIAIVGTRKPSSYGRRVAREFARDLSLSGFCIVSGLAEGIDTEAHDATLASDGRTCAVLGGGLAHCYPHSNRFLMEQIQQSGGVWTEFPIWRRADRRSFPQRNRIVAGLSEAVLVVESGNTGGSLITARMASEQGKNVYVIPGRIDAPESTGCHELIREGAQLVTSVDEILQDLNHLPGILKAASGPFVSSTRIATQEVAEKLGANPLKIWEYLSAKRQGNVDKIADGTGLKAPEVVGLLLDMELDGYVNRKLDGNYEIA